VFDLDRFIADCQVAVAQDSGTRAVREVVARAVRVPEAVMAALGAPQRAGLNVVFRSPEVTILNVVWGPQMTIMPHNHHMWAVIGVYTGREDNIFWRRLPADAPRPIEAAGASSLLSGDVCPLGPEIIHSVTNPVPRLTGAIHVYGGDFLVQEREEFDAETLREQPYDLVKARRLFEDSNRLLQGA
jgi:predicted metal-dependent enzyme (double-stranded beta helix superfamily)